MKPLDRIDRKIITTLQANSRISLTELASQVGLSKTPCQIRMRRLESEGFIIKYGALVDHAKLGGNHIAFVQVSLSDTKTKSLSAFNKATLKIPEIEQCHMIAGGFDYLLKIRTTSMEKYREILGEKISTLPFVIQTSTFVVMETVKDFGS